MSPGPATATFSPTATAPVGVATAVPIASDIPAVTASLVPPTVLPSATGVLLSTTPTPPAATATVPSSSTPVTTIAAPPELTLQTDPLVPEVSIAASRCATLDSATTAGLFQAQSPAQIGVVQTLCLGGFPVGEPVTVALTGRPIQIVALSDDDSNGYGYGTVTFIPTRADRTISLALTASTSTGTAQGQVVVGSIVPATTLAPIIGDTTSTFYALFTFPDATPRDLFLYRRSNATQFELVRRISVIPRADTCATLDPCFAADLTFSREMVGEYRLVEYAPGSGFRLFPSDVAPLGFVVAAAVAPPPAATIEVATPPSTTIPDTVTATPTVSEVATETPIVLPSPTATLPPTATQAVLPVTPVPTTTVVITWKQP